MENGQWQMGRRANSANIREGMAQLFGCPLVQGQFFFDPGRQVRSCLAFGDQTEPLELVRLNI
jgi:hypothetical protein